MTTVTVVRPAELGPVEADLWARFQRTSPSTLSPFFSLTFAQAVGRNRPGARVAVIEVDAKPRAFLPFDLVSKAVGAPIGQPLNDLQGFVHSGAPIDARKVVRAVGLRAWRFDNVPLDQSALLRFGTATSRAQVIDIGDGYESYVKSIHERSTSTLAKLARKRRALHRDVGPVSLVWHSTNSEHLRQTIAWKSEQYRRTGVHDLFSDPATLQIVEELAGAEGDDCRGVVSVLLAGDRVVAGHLGIASPLGLNWWFPAYDRELARYSPGVLLLLAAIEEAPRQDTSRIDLGKGEQRFKVSLANDSHSLIEGSVRAGCCEQVALRAYRRLQRLVTARRR